MTRLQMGPRFVYGVCESNGGSPAVRTSETEHVDIGFGTNRRAPEQGHRQAGALDRALAHTFRGLPSQRPQPGDDLAAPRRPGSDNFLVRRFGSDIRPGSRQA